MIKSFKHKGLQLFFEQGKVNGIQPRHSKKLRMQLAVIHSAVIVEDIDMPGFDLHPLKGKSKSRYAVSVNGNWRITFEFENSNAYILDYEDYH